MPPKRAKKASKPRTKRTVRKRVQVKQAIYPNVVELYPTDVGLYPTNVHGAGFFSDVGNAFKSVGNFVAKNVKPSTALNIAGKLGVPGASTAGTIAGAVGLGHQRGHGVVGIVQTPMR